VELLASETRYGVLGALVDCREVLVSILVDFALRLVGVELDVSTFYSTPGRCTWSHTG
jgi:hypothetical protein